jgi:spore maturation protein CgeB
VKILFSSYHNPRFITITEYIELAIERLKHSLISFDDRNFLIPGRIRQKITFLQNWDLRKLNSKLISLAFSKKPDLCLIAGGHRISPKTVKKIRDRGILTVLWIIDVMRDPQPIMDAAPYYDLIFYGGTEAQEQLAKAGIKNTHWLPFACNSEVHKPASVTLEEKKKWGSDVTFVGSFYPNRGQTLEKICDFDLKVWGPGWYDLSSNSPLRSLVKDTQLKPEEWRKIFSSSKIIVAIHYQDGKTPCYQASPKVYETLACQGFLLVDSQKDVRTLFEDGKHLVIFKDIKDLREKVGYYLNHPEERKRITEQGYKEVLQKHTYIHRIEKLLHTIKARA